MGRDIITLKVPAKPEYVLAIRLTTSAISSRMGFDIDDIEDIKVAVAEACIAIMNQGSVFQNISMIFEIDDELKIGVEGQEFKSVERTAVEEEQGELSIYIIESLMDDVQYEEMNNGDKKIIQKIYMKKRKSR